MSTGFGATSVSAKLHIQYHTSSLQPGEEGGILPILQTRKVRFRKVRRLTQTAH